MAKIRIGKNFHGIWTTLILKWDLNPWPIICHFSHSAMGQILKPKYGTRFEVLSELSQFTTFFKVWPLSTLFHIFVKKLNFGQKIEFWIKIEFLSKIEFWSKNRILVQNFLSILIIKKSNLVQKSNFFKKSNFDIYKKTNFGLFRECGKMGLASLAHTHLRI